MDIYNAGVEEELAVLRKKSAPVEKFDENLSAFIDTMIESMKEDNGIGLAAPQVGENKRIFVCSVDKNEPLVFINPEIIETSMETSIYEEGCLSLPGMYAHVERPERVKIQAWNRRGRPFKLDADDLLATCIQHELDHLNGVLFVDHLPEKKREKIFNKLKKVNKKK